MKKSSAIGLFAAIFFFSSLKTKGQPVVIGPSCVLTGIEYQYNIKGNLPAGSQLCVTGGTISGSSASCITNLSVGYVRIVWSGTKGAIAFSCSEGNSSKEITITTPLQPGAITASKEQFINYSGSVSSISCSKPTGGGCGASYSFQWQRSLDNLNWENISGATGQNLSNISALTETNFYRRKTIENISGSIAYSDAAVIYVAVDMSGH